MIDPTDVSAFIRHAHVSRPLLEIAAFALYAAKYDMPPEDAKAEWLATTDSARAAWRCFASSYINAWISK